MTARWPVLSDRVGIQDRHDFERKATDPFDHTDEILALTRALTGDLAPYSAQGILTMSHRLAWLVRGERR